MTPQKAKIRGCVYVSRNLRLTARLVAALLPLSLEQPLLELQTQLAGWPSTLPSVCWSKRETQRSESQAMSVVRIPGLLGSVADPFKSFNEG